MPEKNEAQSIPLSAMLYFLRKRNISYTWGGWNHDTLCPGALDEEQSLHFKCKVDRVIRVMCCFWCKTTIATVIETGEPKELWYKLSQGFLTPSSALTQTGFYIPGVEIPLHAALKRWSANLFVMWVKQIASTNSECFWCVHLLCLFKSPAQSLEADLV